MPMLLRVLRLGRRELALALLASVCLLATTAADLTLLVLLRRFLDGVLSPPGGLPLGLAALALGVAVLRGSAGFLGRRLGLRAHASLAARLRAATHATLQALPLGFHLGRRPGDLQAVVVHDTAMAAHLVSSVAPSLLEAPVRALALGVVLWQLHAGIATATLLLAPVAALAARVAARHLRRRYRESWAAFGDLHDHVGESLAAIELTRAFGREREERGEFEAANRRVLEGEQAVHGVQAALAPAGDALRLAALAVALVWGAHEIASGQLSAGTASAVLVAVWALLGSFEALVGLASSAQAGLAGAERLLAVLDAPRPTPARDARPATFTRALELEKVGFAYPGGRQALRDVSLRLERGERVALVGHSGAGKTTLLRLLLRLHDPSSGRIALDGVDLRELDVASLRRLVAVVPQDVFLFDRSIRDNVAWGAPEADAEALERALATTGLDRIARTLPEGLDTLVGPRGAALSAGERQRVALARAALRAAPLVLLDEAFSALDNETEAELLDVLERIVGDGALLMVTHRLEAVRLVTRVVVIDAGAIVEEGDPRRLAAASGPYRRLLEATGRPPGLTPAPR